MRKIVGIGILAAALMMSACGVNESQSNTQNPVDIGGNETTASTQTDNILDDIIQDTTEGATENTTDTTTETDTEATSEDSQNIDADIVKVNPGDLVDYKGTLLSISISEEDANGGGVAVLTYGDKTVQVSDYVERLASAYIIPIDEEFFEVVVQTCFSNDWSVSYLVKCSEDGLLVETEIDGGIGDDSEVSKESLVFHSRANVLGTYQTITELGLDDGTFVNKTDYTVFDNQPDPSVWDNFGDITEDQRAYYQNIYAEDGRRILVLKQDLVAVSEDGSEWKIPSGSVLYPEGYQKDSNTFFFALDGKKGSFVYEKNEDGYSYSIQGVGENEMFEAVWYVG